MYRGSHFHNYERLGNITFRSLTYLLTIAGAIGWILNIKAIVLIVNNPVTGMFILRCVGVIIFPLGMVLGYM
jgi:hypothetical protein